MSTFLSKLFTYKQTDKKTPLEDCLTECLCELFNRLDSVDMSGFLLEEIFGLNFGRDLKLTWTTQHVIQSEGVMYNKRPDLVGQGSCITGDVFILVENKIDACFTEHYDLLANEAVGQLHIYKRYLEEKRNEKNKAIALLTHLTMAPEGWTDSVIAWRRLHRVFTSWMKNTKWDTDVIPFLLQNIIKFMEEHEMEGSKLELDEIAVVSAWRHLMDTSSRFGCYGSESIRKYAPKHKVGPFQVVNGNAQGEFYSPNYFGWVLTPKGEKATDANSIIWCGSILGKIYDAVGTKIETVPELSVGIALWIDRSHYDENMRKSLSRMMVKLEKASDLPWEVTDLLSPRDKDCMVAILSCRRSYIDVYAAVNQSNGGDNYWDDYVKDFFDNGFYAITQLGEEDLQALAKIP